MVIGQDFFQMYGANYLYFHYPSLLFRVKSYYFMTVPIIHIMRCRYEITANRRSDLK